MSYSPILIVPGEKKSIFFEIFFKSINSKVFLSPLILICNKNNLKNEIKKNRFKKPIEQIELKKIYLKKFSRKKIYLIDVKSPSSNFYVYNCFAIAFDLIRKGLTHKLLNGPINKTQTLKLKYLGVTEFVAKKFRQNKFAMLIYNKNLSVCPITTHLPINLDLQKKSTKFN